MGSPGLGACHYGHGAVGGGPVQCRAPAGKSSARRWRAGGRWFSPPTIPVRQAAGSPIPRVWVHPHGALAAGHPFLPQIAQGQTDTQMLYQSDTLVVFKDINPHAPVHLLLVPKKHIRSVNDIADADREILAELTMVAKEMAREHGVAKSGYKLLYNVEKGGGQLVFHLHMHLLGGWR